MAIVGTTIQLHHRVAGLAASFAAESWGYVAPFMMSLALLVAGTVLVATTWKENYGDSTVGVTATFSNAVSVMRNGNSTHLS